MPSLRSTLHLAARHCSSVAIDESMIDESMLQDPEVHVRSFHVTESRHCPSVAVDLTQAPAVQVASILRSGSEQNPADQTRASGSVSTSESWSQDPMHAPTVVTSKSLHPPAVHVETIQTASRAEHSAWLEKYVLHLLRRHDVSSSMLGSLHVPKTHVRGTASVVPTESWSQFSMHSV